MSKPVWIPWGLQRGVLEKVWCYIVDKRFYNRRLGENPGVLYVDGVAEYHAGDTIDLCGYRWTILDCRLMGYSFSCKKIVLINGIPI